MSGKIIHVDYIPPYKKKKSGGMQQNRDSATLNSTTVPSTSTGGYVDYSDEPKTVTKKKAPNNVVKKSKPRKSAPKTSGQGYLIYLGHN